MGRWKGDMGRGKWGGEGEIHITHTAIQSHSAISWREGERV